MIKQQKEEDNNIYECQFLCGRIAIDIIKPTEETDLHSCENCRHLLDLDDKMKWIPF